jgi:hypothetical protein
VEERLARIENAVEAIAVEIERVSESQRFTTKLLAGRDPLHPGDHSAAGLADAARAVR